MKHAPSAPGTRQEAISQLEVTHRQQVAEITELRDCNRQQNEQIEELQFANRSQESLIAELRHVQQHVAMLNRDLQFQNGALRAANHELESFCYAVSHDLRGPLRGIHGFSAALQRSASTRLSEEEQGYLTRICSGVERMGRLIDDLLQLSRLTRVEMRRTTVDLSGLAREIAAQLQERDSERRVEWKIEDGLSAEGDPILLRVALDNLLGNAWKYTARKSEAWIAFRRDPRGEGLTFCIEDNGAGFNMAYADKLFTPFQRLHSARDFPGSGVGLASVARVIHRHGGRVFAESIENEGAAFYFTLPGQPPPAQRPLSAE